MLVDFYLKNGYHLEFLENYKLLAKNLNISLFLEKCNVHFKNAPIYLKVISYLIYNQNSHNKFACLDFHMTLEELTYFILFTFRENSKENVKMIVMALSQILTIEKNSLDTIFYSFIILKKLSESF